MLAHFYINMQHSKITFGSSSKPETDKWSDNSEHFRCQQCVDLTSVRIRSYNFKYFSPSNDDFLLFATAEVALDCVRDARSTLKCQVVQVHDLFDVSASPVEMSPNIKALKLSIQINATISLIDNFPLMYNRKL